MFDDRKILTPACLVCLSVSEFWIHRLERGTHGHRGRERERGGRGFIMSLPEPDEAGHGFSEKSSVNGKGEWNASPVQNKVRGQEGCGYVLIANEGTNKQ